MQIGKDYREDLQILQLVLYGGQAIDQVDDGHSQFVNDNQSFIDLLLLWLLEEILDEELQLHGDPLQLALVQY